jgi:hypothetical protein
MLNEMEKRALEMLLDGDDDRLAVLRRQLDGVTVAERELSGTGFFTRLSVAADLPRLEGAKRLVMGDVYAEVTGLQHPAGFLLFVIDGALGMLECFSFDDRWPEGAEIRRAYYMRPATPGSPSLVETRERDLRAVFQGAVDGERGASVG